MGKSVGSLQFGDMDYQPELADIFTIDSVVPTLKRDTVIPDVTVSVYRLVQFTIAVITIQLELVGFHQGLSFWLSCPCYRSVGDPCDRGSILPRKTTQLYRISHAI